jgi:hypothetical protein
VLNTESSIFSVIIANLPSGTYNMSRVFIRSDTFDYVRQLLDSTFVDFIDKSFPNDEIEPALGTDVRITRTQIVNGVGIVNTQLPHNAIENQAVYISNVDSTYNGNALIIDIPNDFTFTYVATGLPNTPQRFPTVKSVSVTHKQLENYKTTLTTNSPHGFKQFDTVVIDGVDNGTNTIAIFNGTHPIAEINSPTSFSYFSGGIYNQDFQESGGTAVVTPTLTSGTYGSFPYNSEFGLSYSGSFSGSDADNTSIRGFELKSVGEELENYSDLLNGFEYRIDCDYDFEQAEFKRTFVLMPIQLPGAPADGSVSPISRFPGANDLVFEYPGNVDQFSMEESAENSATRFFVRGNIPDLGQDISQPYAAATNQDLLSAGWPLLDEIDDKKDISNEEELYSHAQRYLLEFQPPVTKMTVSVNGSMFPQVDSLRPGLWCSLYIDDQFFRERLASPLEPRDDILLRKINSVKVSVPNMPTFPEKVTLDLIPEWEVDTGKKA